MTAATDKNFAKVFNKLQQTGFLLVSGSEIPDVRELITGRSSKGSWWADPAAHEIFAVNERLEAHPDVTITKLISGKVTFVHRSIWRELFAVANAREDWQFAGLSDHAQLLLHEVDRVGSLFTHKLRKSAGVKPGEITRELELRLLIHSEQVHTETGAHAKLAETWEAWAKRIDFKCRPLNANLARQSLEKRLALINKQYSGSGKLPWPSKIQ